MFKLNKKMEYALMSLDYIQKHSHSLVTAKQISDEQKLSFDGVARVLQILSLNQVLVSEKGISGGYRLGLPFQDLNFYELMTIVLGETGVAKCLTSSGLCELSSTCSIKGPVSKLNDQLINFYKNLSVRKLLHKEITEFNETSVSL